MRRCRAANRLASKLLLLGPRLATMGVLSSRLVEALAARIYPYRSTDRTVAF